MFLTAKNFVFAATYRIFAQFNYRFGRTLTEKDRY
jgi:hypothetical protein